MSIKSIEVLVGPIKDSDGRFLPYCDFGWHQGIIRIRDYKECERRGCNHYKRLYIPRESTTTGGINSKNRNI